MTVDMINMPSLLLRFRPSFSEKPTRREGCTTFTDTCGLSSGSVTWWSCKILGLADIKTSQLRHLQCWVQSSNCQSKGRLKNNSNQQLNCLRVLNVMSVLVVRMEQLQNVWDSSVRKKTKTFLFLLLITAAGILCRIWHQGKIRPIRQRQVW